MFKRIALILAVVLVGGVIYYAVQATRNQPSDELTSIQLDQAHQIINSDDIPKPDYRGDLVSPNTGEWLEQIIISGEMIYEGDSTISGDALSGYYSPGENLTWIKERVDTLTDRWYGPYPGKITPLTNINL
jgi:hypothetical protein